MSVCFSPDGAMIVPAGGDNTVRVWNALTREQAARDAAPMIAFSAIGSSSPPSSSQAKSCR
jgi:WD40 repeat protein